MRQEQNSTSAGCKKLNCVFVSSLQGRTRTESGSSWQPNVKVEGLFPLSWPCYTSTLNTNLTRHSQNLKHCASCVQLLAASLRTVHLCCTPAHTLPNRGSSGPYNRSSARSMWLPDGMGCFFMHLGSRLSAFRGYHRILKPHQTQ